MAQPTTVIAELDRLASEFLACVEARDGSLPTVPHDSTWASVAITERANQELDYWRPTQRHEPLSLDGLASALEVELPPAYTEYFGHFWSGSIPVMWGERPFELLQLWNKDDENNLMHNVLGHVLEKRRVREPLTVFFALVDDARFLSINVDSHAVMLEEVGGARPEEVSGDLVSLLASVTATAGE